jgi:hypothetical protein
VSMAPHGLATFPLVHMASNCQLHRTKWECRCT